MGGSKKTIIGVTHQISETLVLVGKQTTKNGWIQKKRSLAAPRERSVKDLSSGAVIDRSFGATL